MSTTFSQISLVRRVAVGNCSGPQGADGVLMLAGSAFRAMLAADWKGSGEKPSIPVHEFDRGAPSGDAFKAIYGYTAEDRKEMSNCGAVCYTWKMPDDSRADTGNSVAEAEITQIKVQVIGDRYLDAGAFLYAVVTTSETPPSIAEFIDETNVLAGRYRSVVVCATGDQTDVARNKRQGIVGNVTLRTGNMVANGGDATSTAYLHICLALSDYESAVGAWIDGGAMIVPDSVQVTFSREVVSDDGVTAPLNLGKVSSGSETYYPSPVSRRQDCYIISIPQNESFLDLATNENYAAHLIAEAYQDTPWSLRNPETSGVVTLTTAAYGITRTTLCVSAFSRAGIVPAGNWSAIRFLSAHTTPCAGRLVIFGKSGPTALSSKESTGICLAPESVMARSMIRADETPPGSMSRYAKILAGDFVTDPALAPAMESIDMTLLAAHDFSAGATITEVGFETPLKLTSQVPDLYTIVGVFVPSGFGGGSTMSRTTVTLGTFTWSIAGHSPSWYGWTDFEEVIRQFRWVSPPVEYVAYGEEMMMAQWTTNHSQSVYLHNRKAVTAGWNETRAFTMPEIKVEASFEEASGLRTRTITAYTKSETVVINSPFALTTTNIPTVQTPSTSTERITWGISHEGNISFSSPLYTTDITGNELEVGTISTYVYVSGNISVSASEAYRALSDGGYVFMLDDTAQIGCDMYVSFNEVTQTKTALSSVGADFDVGDVSLVAAT